MFESRMKNEIDENDLFILLNQSELSRSFDRHSKFTIDHCKLLIAAITHVKRFFREKKTDSLFDFSRKQRCH